jgi:hypothetical protein
MSITQVHLRVTIIMNIWPFILEGDSFFLGPFFALMVSASFITFNLAQLAHNLVLIIYKVKI